MAEKFPHCLMSKHLHSQYQKVILFIDHIHYFRHFLSFLPHTIVFHHIDYPPSKAHICYGFYYNVCFSQTNDVLLFQYAGSVGFVLTAVQMLIYILTISLIVSLYFINYIYYIHINQIDHIHLMIMSELIVVLLLSCSDYVPLY